MTLQPAEPLLRAEPVHQGAGGGGARPPRLLRAYRPGGGPGALIISLSPGQFFLAASLRLILNWISDAYLQLQFQAVLLTQPGIGQS